MSGEDYWKNLKAGNFIVREDIWYGIFTAVKRQYGKDHAYYTNLCRIRKIVKALIRYLPNANLESENQMIQSNTPHPHAEILHAIADGRTDFQRQYQDESAWEDCQVEDILYYIHQQTENPKFRIKPETKTGWLAIYKDGKTILFKYKPVANEFDLQILEAITQITYTPGEGL